MQEFLPANRLTKLKEQKRTRVHRLRHASGLSNSLGGIMLASIEGAKEGGIGIGDHPSSPSSSASRMAFTSPAEKTRSPHASLICAIQSGLDNLRAEATGGTKRATTRPRLVMSTDSPLSISAETRRKLFRKSATVAVFMIAIIYHSISESSLREKEPSAKTSPYGSLPARPRIPACPWRRSGPRLRRLRDPGQ